MLRRDFIKAIGGSTIAWPLTARAQQAERMRRIGVLMAYAESNPIGQSEVAAFRKALQELGLKDGDNLQIDVRWGANNLDLERKYATELIALAPDAILAFGTLSVAALQGGLRNRSDCVRRRR